MLTISDALKAWKHEVGQRDPLLMFIDLALDGSTAIHLVAGLPTGKQSISFLGETYTAVEVRSEDQQQSIEGDLKSFKVSVSNVDRGIGFYVENFDLEGLKLKITYVPASRIASGDPQDRLVEEYFIQDQAYDGKVAVFTLGYPDLVRRQAPAAVYNRTKCGWNYEARHLLENGCRYPSDEFDADSRQDFLVNAIDNAEKIRLHGWRTLNALRANLWFDVDISDPLSLSIRSDNSSDPKLWRDGDRDGPFVYKLLAGDFDCWTQLNSQVYRPESWLGILCQDPATPGDWIAIADMQNSASERRVSTVKTDNSVSAGTETDSGTDHDFLRLERAGSTFRTYYKGSLGGSWILHREETLSMGSLVRIGCYIASRSISAATFGASFGFLRFTAGGLGSCDLTLAGANGCRVHENTRRFFAFPAIPRP